TPDGSGCTSRGAPTAAPSTPPRTSVCTRSRHARATARSRDSRSSPGDGWAPLRPWLSGSAECPAGTRTTPCSTSCAATWSSGSPARTCPPSLAGCSVRPAVGSARPWIDVSRYAGRIGRNAEVMPRPLAGIRVGILQTRYGGEFAALIEREGGLPLLAPCMREVRVDDMQRLRGSLDEVAREPVD